MNGMFKNISKEASMKKKRLLIISLFVFIVMLPYILGYVNTPKNSIFTGLILNTGDPGSYLSKMRNAEHGFHFINNFTTGETYGGYHFLFYILLGKVAVYFNLQPIYIFHISRVIISLLFAVYLYKLLDEFKLKSYQKNLIAFLVLFCSNFSFVINYKDLIKPYNTYAPTFIADMFVSTAALYMPHIIFTMLLQVISFKIMLHYKENRALNGLKISFLLLLIAFIHSFTAFMMGVIYGVNILLSDIDHKEINYKNLMLLLLLGVFPFPYMLYSLYAFSNYPMLIKWQEQGVTMFWSFRYFIGMTGLFFVISMFIFLLKWTWTKERRPLALWVLLSWICAIYPTYFQIRFTEGIIIPIAILFGWYFTEKMNFNHVIKILLIIILTFNTFILAIAPLFFKSPLSYLNQEQVEIYEWIEENVNYDEIILSNFVNGNLIPGFTGKKVALGHSYETIDVNKWADVYYQVAIKGDFNEIKNSDIRYYLLDKKTSIDPKDKSFVKMIENNDYILYKIESR